MEWSKENENPHAEWLQLKCMPNQQKNSRENVENVYAREK